MTSKKRVEIGPGEGEVEPKRRRGDGEETKEESEEAPETQSATAAPPPRRRARSREWLSFSGRRQPRVGGDFQVAMLPSPGDSNKEEGTRQEKNETKEEE